MPRNEQGVYSRANSPVVPGTTIESAEYNTTIEDIVNEMNGIRLISAGGTGANSLEAARTAMEVAKSQISTYDRTAGRAMLVGAFGIGGNAGEWMSSDGQLTDIIPTSIRRVTAAVAGLVGAPAAVAGLVFTRRYDGANAVQIYEPISKTAPWPWRRVQVAGDWTDWVRDFDAGTTTTGTWTRRADGQQTCIGSLDFTYESADVLSASWVFPKPFIEAPVCGYALRKTSLTFVGGVSSRHIGALSESPTATSSIALGISRIHGAPDFTNNMVLVGVRVIATGRWLTI